MLYVYTRWHSEGVTRRPVELVGGFVRCNEVRRRSVGRPSIHHQSSSSVPRPFPSHH